MNSASAPQFSILIPLEFHRGLAEKCVKAWCSGQDFPRDRYEVIVAAPSSCSEADLELLRDLLGPSDRLEVFSHEHDMDLVAEAARMARGNLLLFTEAHCLPNPDILTQASRIMDENPAWAGFSGGSIPITHNLLSEIEAEMYAEDIRRNLEDHPWLKVLDQCLILKRSAYEQSGGLEPEYGHFAEWILATRLHLCGFEVGYDPSAAIHHYYIGDLEDLVEFTEDFGAGQLRFSMLRGEDPCADLLDSAAAWEDRFGFHPPVARSMFRLLLRDLAGTGFKSSNQKDGSPSGRAGRLLAWLGRAVSGTFLPCLAASANVKRLRRETEEQLRKGDKALASAAFIEMILACEHNGQLRTVRLQNRSRRPRPMDSFGPVKRSGKWICGDANSIIRAGFLSASSYQDRSFCWTLPEAMVWLPVAPGDYRIKIRWIEFTPFPTANYYTFYQNEKPIPPDRTLLFPGGIEISVTVRAKGGLRLGWTCPRFDSPGDPRSLGMPLKEISWKLIKTEEPTRSTRLTLPPVAPSSARPGTPWRFTRRAPLYFLHPTKCMGTTIRLFLENAFPAEDIFASNREAYYVRDLREACIKREPGRFYRGHMRWDLPATLPDRDWTIVTTLREPRQRLLSLCDYSVWIGNFPKFLSLEDWLTNEIRVDQTLLSFFVANSESDPARGLEEVAARARDFLDEALANLASCRVVGLQERPKETVALISRATGALAPSPIPIVNASPRTHPLEELPSSVQQMLDEVTECDRVFYEAGCRLFEQQWSALLDEGQRLAGRALDAPDDVLDFLRRPSLDWLAELQPADPDSTDEIVWQPADLWPGDNLDSREATELGDIRWTGPNPDTQFYFLLRTNAPREIAIGLHPATPVPHAQSAELTVNKHPVPLSVELDTSGCPSVLRGQIDLKMLNPQESSGLHRFVLSSLVVRLEGDIRTLGLCLKEIQFRPLPDSS